MLKNSHFLRIIELYLMTIALQDVIFRAILGNLNDLSIHPALLIRLFILILLGFYYAKRLLIIRVTNLNISLLLLLSFFIAHLILVELIQFKLLYITTAILDFSKVLIYFLLVYHVNLNYTYYRRKASGILLFNSVVVITNVVISNVFQVGFQNYDTVESFRGFMAANVTAVFCMIAFLYFISRRKTSFNSFFILLSLLSFYFIKSKVIVLAFVFGIFQYLKSKSLQYKTTLLATVTITFIPIFVFFSQPILTLLQQDLLNNYFVNLNKSQGLFESSDSIFFYLNYITPGRALVAEAAFNFLSQTSVENLLFGFGSQGTWDLFRRPPMMDFVNFLLFYGIFGASIIYYHQFKLIYDVIKNKRIDTYVIILISIFLYSFLGGFVMNVATTVSIYALLVGITLPIANKKLTTKEIQLTHKMRHEN